MSNQVSTDGGVRGPLGFDIFGDHAGAIGDEAVDHGDVGTVEDALKVVGEGDVLRHEDVGGDAGGGGVGCEGSGGVACAGDGKVLEAIVFGHGDGEAEAAGFEGAGGIGSLLLDIEAGVALALEEGGPAFAEGDGGYVGKNACVAPHAEAGGGGGSAGGDFIAYCSLFELVHVVADIEGAAAEGAEGLGGVGGKVVVTAGAFERSDKGHILDVTGFRGREGRLLSENPGRSLGAIGREAHGRT